MKQTILVVYAAEAPMDADHIRVCPPTEEGLQAVLDAEPDGALLAIGGDAYAPPLPWRAWARQLPRHRPGLGEALRTLLKAQGHPGAALVAAEGAEVNGRLIMVAPDDAAVRDAALGLLSELSGASQLSVSSLSAPPAPPAVAESTQPEPTVATSETKVSIDTPVDAEAPEVPVPHWQAALSQLGWTLEADHARLPEVLGRFAPVRQVLEGAHERRRAKTKDGEERILCAYPDFRRGDAKVIAVGAVRDEDDRETVELLALHRHPMPTGTCSPSSTWTPSSDLLPGPVCVQRTGRAPSGSAQLFAVDGRTVYLRRGNEVVSWDGNKEQRMGTPSQCLASLTLRWSSR